MEISTNNNSGRISPAKVKFAPDDEKEKVALEKVKLKQNNFIYQFEKF